MRAALPPPFAPMEAEFSPNTIVPVPTDTAPLAAVMLPEPIAACEEAVLLPLPLTTAALDPAAMLSKPPLTCV